MSSASVTRTATNTNPDATSTHAPTGSYNLAVGYLGAFTLLVMAHHAVLAYLDLHEIHR